MSHDNFTRQVALNISDLCLGVKGACIGAAALHGDLRANTSPLCGRGLAQHLRTDVPTVVQTCFPDGNEGVWVFF